MRPPVVGISPENELLPALPVVDEEGAAPDRPTGLRVVHPVDPDLREVLATECMRRKDEREQAAPARRTSDAARREPSSRRRRECCGRRSGASGRPRCHSRGSRWSVKTKSRAVTGTPSLQRASGRMRYVSVKGRFFVYVTPDTSLGWNVKRRSMTNGDSRTFSATGLSQSSSRTLRHAGSELGSTMTSVPPRFGAGCGRSAARPRDSEERDGDGRCER